MGKRLDEIDNLRAIAIATVVLGHSIILYSPQWGVYATTRSSDFLAGLKNIINVFQMPLFFSISGFCFVSTVRRKRFLEIVKDKFFRLMVPYFCVAVCYMVPIRMIAKYPGYADLSYFQILMGKILTGQDVGHLWFLPTLFAIFVGSAAVIRILSRMGAKQWISQLVLCAVALVLYVGSRVISFPLTFIQSLAEYFSEFVFGYILSSFQEFLTKCSQKIVLKTALAAMSGFLLWQVGGMLAALAIVLTLYAVVPRKSCQAVRIIGRNSFGIYLFHSPLIYITFCYFPNENPYLISCLNFFLWGGTAFFLSEGIRRTKLRFIIGE